MEDGCMKYQQLRFYSLVGVFFTLAGLLLGSQHFIEHWQRHNAQPFFATAAAQQQRPSTPTPTQPAISGQPTHIDIPRVGISLDVAPGYYNKTSQTWTLTTNKAHYATITPPPN